MTTVKPSGLTYVGNIISDELHGQLLDWLESKEISAQFFPVKNAQGISSEKSRLVLHYGYSYDYQNNTTKNTAPPIPKILHRLMDLKDSFSREYFNQCIINRYLPGQGINAHSDRLAYGSVIACFTIGGGVEIEFTRRDDTYKIYTEPRSMYVMEGEARYQWLHAIRPRKSDPNYGQRKTRYSITFRNVPSK